MIDVERIRREEFPTRSGIYLDNATLGPLPNRHVRAVTNFMELMSAQRLRDLFRIRAEGVDQVRNKAAALLRCELRQERFQRTYAVCSAADSSSTRRLRSLSCAP